MEKQKYVRFKKEDKPSTFLIFPYLLTHKEVADWLQPAHVSSAGFVELINEGGELKYHCYGKSTSLGIESSLNDSHDLNFHMGID